MYYVLRLAWLIELILPLPYSYRQPKPKPEPVDMMLWQELCKLQIAVCTMYYIERGCWNGSSSPGLNLIRTLTLVLPLTLALALVLTRVATTTDPLPPAP